MTAAGMIVAFAGYAIASYGYVLIRGWDISWASWINPLSPYKWPASGSPATVPASQVFP